MKKCATGARHNFLHIVQVGYLAHVQVEFAHIFHTGRPMCKWKLLYAGYRTCGNAAGKSVHGYWIMMVIKLNFGNLLIKPFCNLALKDFKQT